MELSPPTYDISIVEDSEYEPEPLTPPRPILAPTEGSETWLIPIQASQAVEDELDLECLRLPSDGLETIGYTLELGFKAETDDHIRRPQVELKSSQTSIMSSTHHDPTQHTSPACSQSKPSTFVGMTKRRPEEKDPEPSKPVVETNKPRYRIPKSGSLASLCVSTNSPLYRVGLSKRVRVESLHENIRRK